MKQEWVSTSLSLARTPASFYSGCRKIIGNFSFSFDNVSSDLLISDSGFTKSKMSMLRRNYLNQPSLDAGLLLWEQRRAKRKYGSIGVSTYNHFMKGDVKGATPRGSVMGPCIQAFTITLHNDGSQVVDVFYRTTELFKKFPADLVFLRDELLHPFHLTQLASIHFHFANITCHPMYFITLVPHLRNPITELERLRRHDKHFYNWVIKWSARYLCPEHSRGIQKFAQALRVQKDALERITPATQRSLRDYFKKNHPGHRNDYNPDGDEDE